MSNGLILPSREYFEAAPQNGAGATARLALPAANAAVEAVITGTNQSYGCLTFADAVLARALLIIRLAPDVYLPGGLAVRLLWSSPAVAGDALWSVQTAFVAEGDVLDPAFNAAQEQLDTVDPDAGALNITAFTGLDDTGAVAGALMFLRIARDASDSDNTLTDEVHLIGVEFQYQRLVVLP